MNQSDAIPIVGIVSSHWKLIASALEMGESAHLTTVGILFEDWIERKYLIGSKIVFSFDFELKDTLRLK